jgi:hypothetical protein
MNCGRRLSRKRDQLSETVEVDETYLPGAWEEGTRRVETGNEGPDFRWDSRKQQGGQKRVSITPGREFLEPASAMCPRLSPLGSHGPRPSRIYNMNSLSCGARRNPHQAWPEQAHLITFLSTVCRLFVGRTTCFSPADPFGQGQPVRVALGGELPATAVVLAALVWIERVH